jgi:uncharacterized membrane protein YdjX (TVP38/TMEM64 family)
VLVDRSRDAVLRLVALVVAVALGGGLVWLLLGGDVDTVRETVEAAGPWAPLVYLALHIVLTLVPVPKNLLAGIAGALFGLGAGIVLSWVGSVLAAAVGFAVARRLGREAVASLTGPRIGRVEDILEEQGLAAVVIARLTPFLPFTVVNYGAGVSPVSWRDYLAGTAIGVVPGTVAYVALGASAGDARTFVLAGMVAVLLFAGTLLLGRRTRRRSTG